MSSTPTDAPLMEVRDIYKSFGRLEILRGISLQLHRGEILAIVGASGAGKTTLLQVIGTLDAPDRGEVIIGGERLSALSGNRRAAFRNRHLGFVFQSHQLMPEFTAVENVAIPAMISGKSRREAMAEAGELLRHLSLGDRLDHRPAELSGGERQRVAVARAIINHPEIVLADEPTGALDSVRKRELLELFLRLREEDGLSFIVVTHDRETAEIADRSLLLSDGRIVSEQGGDEAPI